MSQDDYRRKPAPFPRSLALMIARKADVMAKRFEDQVVRELTSSARSALNRGLETDQIVRELGL